MALEISAVGQIHISVTDLDRSITFYRDVLGLPFLFRVPGQPMAFFDCGGVRLYLGIPEDERFRSQPMLYFTVPDIDAAYAELETAGAELFDRPHIVNRTDDSELWLAVFTDPDGCKLALMEERTQPAPSGFTAD
ncbi:VOC family protein [Flindersiella endophytica]